MPGGKTQQKLNQVVKSLAKKYNAPVFEPHMTLLGGIQENEEMVVKRTERLVSQLRPFRLTLGKIEFSTTYFQSVFIRVNATACLMEAYIKTQKLFNKDKDTLFMPHISLMYGNHKMSLREKIAQKIKLPKLSFAAKSICVYKTLSGADPKEWKLVEKLVL